MRQAIIPYVMSGINMLAPIIAAYDILQPKVILVAFLLIIIGLPISVIFRQRQYHRILLNLLVMVPLLILTWLLVKDMPGLQLDWADPISSITIHDSTELFLVLLNILVVTAAGRAFILVTSRDLLQTVIPGISICLLTAITPIEGRHLSHTILAMSCLLLLLATSLYLFSYVHSQNWFSQSVPIFEQQRLLRFITLLSLILFPITLVAGYLLRPINMINTLRNHPYEQSNRSYFPNFLGQSISLSQSDQLEIGSKVWPTGNQVVMMVKTNRSGNHLWRANTYASYVQGTWFTLGEWGRDRITKNAPYELPLSSYGSDPGITQAIAEKRISFDLYNSKGAVLSQNFSFQSKWFGDSVPIYASFQLARIRTGPYLAPIIKLGIDGGVAISTATLPNDDIPGYDVDSIIKPSPTLLKLTADPQLSRFDAQNYVQMPTDAYRMTVRRKALAILAASNLSLQSNRYAIVLAFEHYLAENYLYTLSPSPPKNGVDPILDFLLHQRKGYCNYFSGAMVMLCRSLDIPARVVSGFATGEQIPGQDYGVFLYRVRAKDAHSWVEVYLPHYGWYVSDPTAGSTEATNVIAKTWLFLTDSYAIIKANILAYIREIQKNKESRYSFIAGVLLLVIAIITLFISRQEHPPKLPRRTLSNEEARTSIIDSYMRLQRLLKRRGVQKPHDLTASEFLEFFHTLDTRMNGAVDEITLMYLNARYGQYLPTDDDARQAITLLRALWVASKQERNLAPRTEDE